MYEVEHFWFQHHPHSRKSFSRSSTVNVCLQREDLPNIYVPLTRLSDRSNESQISPPTLRKMRASLACFCLLQTQRSRKTFKYDFYEKSPDRKTPQRPPVLPEKQFSQSGTHRLRDTCRLDSVALSQHRGSRTELHPLPPVPSRWSPCTAYSPSLPSSFLVSLPHASTGEVKCK